MRSEYRVVKIVSFCQRNVKILQGLFLSVKYIHLCPLKNEIRMIRSLLSLFVPIILFTNSFANNYGTPGSGVRWTMDDLVNNSGGDVSFSAGAYLVNDTIFIRENDTLSIATDISVKFAANPYFYIHGVLIINPPTGVTFSAQNTDTRYLGM